MGERGEKSMTQKALPFKYEEEKKENGITALGGLPLYLDLAHRAGLIRSICEHVRVRHESQGWTDSQMVMALILLNLAGGDCVEDINLLEADEGFCQVLQRVEPCGLSRKRRREQARRWRKEKKRRLPSPSAVFRYLEQFHDLEEEEKRVVGKACIPDANRHLLGLSWVNRDLLAYFHKFRGEETATLDLDATLVETQKREALFSYKGYKAYQPLNVWWAEQEAIVHTEFRDGNVPAGYNNLRVLQAALAQLPEGIKTVRLRSDNAAYQHPLLKYCERGKNPRFGRIEFAVGCDVTPEYKAAVLQVGEEQWHPIYKRIGTIRIKTDQEWAEVGFVPNAIGHSRNSPEYRYLAIREPLKQPTLPGMEQGLPFPTLEMKTTAYKLFGLVTNMTMEGEELIRWHRMRSGKSEEAHGIMKNDFAGGKLPSGSFGENAAWWWCMILALNLHAFMKQRVLPEQWRPKRMKAVRFHLIRIPARIIDRSRQLTIRLKKGHPSFRMIQTAREKILAMGGVPAG